MYSVVIVDDNKIAVTAIARSTHWENFQCEVTGVAYDGIAGLELIHKECPDIVIIDIQMPGFNGLDIIEKLNQQKQDTQFIIISGYSHFEYAQKAIRYGVSDFLLKPIMTDELEQALKKAVDTLSRNKEREEEEETDSLEGKVQSIRSNREEYSKLVFNAIDYVERNIQRNISLSDICEELLISTSYFSKCFKKETGVGFSNYVTMVKMINAKILLKNPQNRVNEVSRMLGYSDYSYFFQVFKKCFGFAPSDIKQYSK
ncbi:response regulator [Lacrimispora xylanolytica]|jgi:two-component system response regulator YesN|uniref:Stage 0 sporulation protein A homolog n=1 Tax=Lacrimispora xylanolytica TaxID=29375 RepID=A0ABY7AAU5_9FIRM|nr:MULTISPECIES: response regulator [Clostridia]MBS5958854.1 response regulator [Clostridiales bacterium]WAJ22693.1 response regulator [Lacrimispora xylanolytica]